MKTAKEHIAKLRIRLSRVLLTRTERDTLADALDVYYDVTSRRNVTQKFHDYKPLEVCRRLMR